MSGQNLEELRIYQDSAAEEPPTENLKSTVPEKRTGSGDPQVDAEVYRIRVALANLGGIPKVKQ